MATNKYIIQLIVDTGSGQAKVKGISKAFEDLDAQVNKANASINKNSAAMKKGAGSAGIAGAATAEFGRLISDLPYGLQAVTNNMSQLGSMFALLVSSAGSLKDALSAMWKTLMGPAGILIAFQVAIAALEFFSRKTKKAKDDSIDFNLELERQLSGLQAVTTSMNDLNVSEEERIELLEKTKEIGKDIVEAYKKEALSKEEVVRLAEYEMTILKAKELLSKKEKDIEKERKVLEEELLKITEGEERAQKRKVLLMRKGLTEQEAIREINSEITTLGGKQFVQSHSLVALAQKRSELEGKVAFLAKSQEEAYDNMLTAQIEADKIRVAAEQRIAAEQELFEQRLDLEKDILDAEMKRLKDSELNTIQAQRDVQNQIYQLTLNRLEKEKQREQQLITDPETIRLIEEKYKILAEKAGMALRDGIQKSMEQKLDVEKFGAVTGKELIEKPLTESQKVAKDLLKKFGKDVNDELETFFEQTASSRETTDDEWFLETFGFTKDKFAKTAAMVQQGLDAVTGLIDAQLERDLAIEQNKTTALNDQLRQRLRNEQLTADERDKINQEISKNEAALVEKQNEIEEKRFKLNKTQAIANAVINTAVGVSKVLPNIPLAAFIGALGAVQIATIASQKFVAQASSTPSLSSQSRPSESQGPAFNLIGTGGQSQLAQAISSQQQAPVRAYVVAGEVTTAQSMERNRVREASI